MLFLGKNGRKIRTWCRQAGTLFRKVPDIPPDLLSFEFGDFIVASLMTVVRKLELSQISTTRSIVPSLNRSPERQSTLNHCDGG